MGSMSFRRERGFKGKEKEEFVEGVLTEEDEGEVGTFMICKIDRGIVREVECCRVRRG